MADEIEKFLDGLQKTSASVGALIMSAFAMLFWLWILWLVLVSLYEIATGR